MHPFQIPKFYLSTVAFDDHITIPTPIRNVMRVILFYHLHEERMVSLFSYDTGDRPIDGTFCR
jgi:hypothetical protein